MKIALAHWALPPTVGGVESHLVDAASSLVDCGADVTVISGEPRPLRSVFPPGVKFEYVLALDARSWRAHVWDTQRRDADIVGFLDVLQRVRPHVVHAHNVAPAAVSATRAMIEGQRELGFALFHTSHSRWVACGAPPRRSDWDGLFAVSEHLSVSLDNDGWETDVLRLPIDAARFRTRRPAFSSPAVHLLLPGRLVAEKGAGVAVLALERLLASGVDAFLTLTDTPTMLDFTGRELLQRNLLLNLAPHLVRSGRLRFVRPSWPEMPGVYDASDIVLCPSLFDEPFGLVALEAMSSQRPVVASARGGLQEIVEDGITGCLVPSGDPDAIAESVRHLFASPERARRFGMAGRQRATSRHSLREHAARLVKHYKAALEHSRCSS